MSIILRAMASLIFVMAGIAVRKPGIADLRHSD
jgi:hypothetical protein